MPAGRPAKYKEEYAVLAKNYALLGVTNEQLAKFFNVGVTSIDRWIVEHEEFRCALKEGREDADAKVAQSLYRKAIGGYKVHKLEAFVDKFGEEHTIETWTIAQPDTTSCIFWLKNRQPGRWRDKVEQEITGPEGKELQAPIINVFSSGPDLAGDENEIE